MDGAATYAVEEAAFAIARVAHDGQRRKGNGESYIEHPKRVAKSVWGFGWYARSLAYLHDTIEDTNVTIGALRKIGFPEDLLQDLQILTRSDGGDQTYAEYIHLICQSGSTACLYVKLADLDDNLADVAYTLPDSQRLRYTTSAGKISAELERRGARKR